MRAAEIILVSQFEEGHFPRINKFVVEKKHIPKEKYKKYAFSIILYNKIKAMRRMIFLLYILFRGRNDLASFKV